MAEADPLKTQINMEQAAAALSGFAIVLGDYFKELRRQGFTREEAMELVVEYQGIMFEGGMGKDA